MNNWDKHLNHLNFLLFSSPSVSRKACHKDLLFFFYFDHKRETAQPTPCSKMLASMGLAGIGPESRKQRGCMKTWQLQS